MRNIFTVFRKEMYRVLSDMRLVLMIFLLPGISIFAMYWLIGTLIQNQTEAVQQHTIIVYEENMPADIRSSLEGLADLERPVNMEFHSIDTLEDSDLKEKVREGDIDVVLRFDADFEAKISNYDQAEAPSLFIIYNYGRQNSSFGYNQISSVLNQYQSMKLMERLEDPSHAQIFVTDYADDIVDERQMTGQGFAMLLPFLIVIFLFAGAMSIGPDSIAGEKERNTIATLLITPIKRSEIAIGKISSLALLSFISALSSFVGLAFSLPKLMQMDTNGVEYNIYEPIHFVLILFTLMATVLIIVGLIAVISAYAKTIKEASMLIMPFYLVTMIIGLLSSFGTEPSGQLIVHFIPIYGSVNFLSSIFVFQYDFANFVAVIVSSVVYTSLFIYLLTRLFSSEKVMFQK